MVRKPKSAKKTLKAKDLKAVKGGALNATIANASGEKQSKPSTAQFRSADGLRSEHDAIE